MWAIAGTASLILFAYLITLPEANHAGRSYAAHGGVYIVSAVLWLWLAEGDRSDRRNLLGVAIWLASAAVMLFGPRTVAGG